MRGERVKKKRAVGVNFLTSLEARLRVSVHLELKFPSVTELLYLLSRPVSLRLFGCAPESPLGGKSEAVGNAC